MANICKIPCLLEIGRVLSKNENNLAGLYREQFKPARLPAIGLLIKLQSEK